MRIPYIPLTATLTPEKSRNLSVSALFIAALVAPTVAVAVALVPEWATYPDHVLAGMLFGLLLGFLPSLLFLGIAFRLVSLLERPRWSYIVAGAGAALAHSAIGLVWVFLYSGYELTFLFGFVFEGLLAGFQSRTFDFVTGIDLYLYSVGAKALGGLCAGAVYGTITRRLTPAVP